MVFIGYLICSWSGKAGTNRTLMLVVEEGTSGLSFEYTRLIKKFNRDVHLAFATTAIVYSTSNPFFRPRSAFLDAPDQLIFLALDELQFIARQLRNPLFQFPFGDIQTSFESQRAHVIWLLAFPLFSLSREPSRTENSFC